MHLLLIINSKNFEFLFPKIYHLQVIDNTTRSEMDKTLAYTFAMKNIYPE